MDADPVVQFRQWFEEATAIGIDLPNAMALATASGTGKPSVRYVLLKDYNDTGFVFYTHSVSEKGKQLAENPNAAVLFYWSPMDRQIRIEGQVEQVSQEEADEYFASRPYGSRVSVWAAPQSSIIRDRDYLESRVRDLEQQYADGEVPRPETWIGYRLRPELFEFWQGRENRLHDRIVYIRGERGDWIIRRLAP